MNADVTEFSSTLPAERSPLGRLERASNELVGSIFYGTLLRQMRSAELKGPYGHGGRGEEMFAAQLDQLLAQRMGAARSTSLSEAIVSRYTDKAMQMDRFRSQQERR